MIEDLQYIIWLSDSDTVCISAHKSQQADWKYHFLVHRKRNVTSLPDCCCYINLVKPITVTI